MSLVVLLGGARSGKSDLAASLASESGAPVSFVATGEALDEEMTARIDRHRSERPTDWTTFEEPLELRRALEAIDRDLDLRRRLPLALGLEPAAPRDAHDAVTGEAGTCASVAATRPGLTIAVSNEVGLGVVPATPLGREYRDLLGAVNRTWVEAADRAAFVVAGRSLALERGASLLPERR